jgi:hypothetical protein
MNYRLLSLSAVSLALLAALPVLADTMQGTPKCGGIGTRSEGWYQDEKLVRYEPCAECSAVCDKVGTKGEGWYDSCDGELIHWGSCAAYSPMVDFADVPTGHAYFSAIIDLKQRGIISGYSDGTFRPGNTINRAEFAKIVIGAAYGMEKTEECMKIADWVYPGVFKDVPADAWYVPFLCVARMEGAIGGYDDDTFRGNNTINYAEAAKILALTFQTPTPKPVAGTVWYKPYVDGLRLSSALPDSYVSADRMVTRGEMAIMISALIGPNEHDPDTIGQFTGAGCKIGGCSAQICVDDTSEDVVSTCEWREEYACYRTARCEKQASGKCGWTQTDEFVACLEEKQ